jgi:hypothetical protein
LTTADIDALLRDIEQQVLEEIQAELAQLEQQELEHLQHAASMAEQHLAQGRGSSPHGQQQPPYTSNLSVTNRLVHA